MYEVVYGELRPDQFVMHTCDNPACVNPNHLQVGSHQDNMDDKAAKGRYGKRKTGYRELTAEVVSEIKKALVSGVSAMELSRQYTKSVQAISHIRHNRSWAEVPWPN